MILLEEDEILDILKFEGVGASDCIGLGDSNISDQGQFARAGACISRTSLHMTSR